MTKRRTPEQWEFLERFSRMDPAMPRSMGLILGFLLVCEPAEQSSKMLQEDLGLSAGSVSTMVGMLVDSGLVTKVKKSGDRKAYYAIVKDSWQRTIELRLTAIKQMRDIASDGLKIADNYRMRELYTVYSFIAEELSEMLRRLDELKAREALPKKKAR
jgi:DNA-binding transcriptional regulator GbsR (MarR family)